MKVRLKINTPWGKIGQIYSNELPLLEKEYNIDWLPSVYYPPQYYPEVFEIIKKRKKKEKGE